MSTRIPQHRRTVAYAVGAAGTCRDTNVRLETTARRQARVQSPRPWSTGRFAASASRHAQQQQTRTATRFKYNETDDARTRKPPPQKVWQNRNSSLDERETLLEVEKNFLQLIIRDRFFLAIWKPIFPETAAMLQDAKSLPQVVEKLGRSYEKIPKTRR